MFNFIYNLFCLLSLFFSHEDVSSGHSPFLRALMDAEAAAISAAVQLASFKDALENEMPVSLLHKIESLSSIIPTSDCHGERELHKYMSWCLLQAPSVKIQKNGMIF